MIEDELKYYNSLCARIKMLQDKVEALEYDLTGVKGVNYDKVIAFGSTDPLIKRLKFIDQCDNIDKLKEILEVEQAHKDIIDNMLKQLNDKERELIRLRFIKGLSYEEIAKRKNYDKGNTHRIIKRIIKKLNNM